MRDSCPVSALRGRLTCSPKSGPFRNESSPGDERCGGEDLQGGCHRRLPSRLRIGKGSCPGYHLAGAGRSVVSACRAPSRMGRIALVQPDVTGTTDANHMRQELASRTLTLSAHEVRAIKVTLYPGSYEEGVDVRRSTVLLCWPNSTVSRGW